MTDFGIVLLHMHENDGQNNLLNNERLGEQ